MGLLGRRRKGFFLTEKAPSVVKYFEEFWKRMLTGEHSKALLRDAKMIIPAPGFSVFLNESKAVNLNWRIHVY